MDHPPKSDRELFAAALELADPAGRAVFLARECANAPARLQRVQSLLEAYAEAGDFLVRGEAVPEAQQNDPVREGPGSVIGNYKLLQEIGVGGFGVVYMAEQLQPIKRKVALKIIKPGMDTREIVARFEAERQALALMVHANIAQVYDAGTTDAGRPFFVMELVKGISLTQFCERNKLSTTQRLELFLDVCSAIQHAHQKGIIHRDIKPSNILVTLHDGKPVPKVIDFGIAKALDRELTGRTLFTAYGQMIGTPQYTSPEQAEMSGLDIDTRADIYSLGVLLYELLTGETPITRKDLNSAGLHEIHKLIREKEPTPPSMLVSILCRTSTALAESHCAEPAVLIDRIKGDLDWIVLKALEKDRNRRYESASDFAQDIRRHLRHEAVLARPPSAAYSFQKLVQRNRLAFTAAAVVMVTIVVGLAVSMTLYLQEKAARARAELAEQEHSRLREEAERQEKIAVESALRAEAAGARTRAALKLVEMALIQELVEKGRSDMALSRLARHLRQDKQDHVAADRLMFLLQHYTTRSPVRPPIRLTNEVSAWLLSPDGQKLATIATETAQLWDVRTGQPVGDPMRQAAKISSVQFNADATKLVTAARLGDTTARIWDALTGQSVGKPMRHHNIIHGTKFSPDGSLIVTCSWDYRARVWDARSGEQVGRDMVHGQDVTVAEFSPDSSLIVTASRDKSARIWNARTGQPLGIPLRHSYTVFLARFSPDGKWVVLGTGGGNARVWDVQTCQPVGEEMRHGGKLTAAAFSPDGQRVLTASLESQSARLWDAHTGEAIGDPMLHQSAVNSAEFSPDGLRVLTASAGGAARVWDGHTGRLLTEPITHEGRLQASQSGGMLGAQFSPVGATIHTYTTTEAHSWDVRNAAPVLRRIQHFVRSNLVQISADGSTVIVSMDRQSVRLFDIRSGRAIGVPMDAGAGLIHTAFSPTGLRVATICANPAMESVVRLWDVRSGAPVGEPMRVSRGAGLQFSPDGKRLWVKATSRVHWMDAWTGVPGDRQLQGEGRLGNLAFSPDSRQVLGCSGATVRVWDASTGEVVGELAHPGEVRDAQFSPDGRWIATAGDDKTARVWDLASQKPLDLLFQHQAAVNTVKFRADGRWLATASKDGTARLWDVQTGEPVGKPLGHQGSVTAIEFSHAGRRIVTASEDSTVRVWDAATGQPLTEPLRHVGSILRVQFGPDDLTVMTVGAVGDLAVWDVPKSGQTGPVPDWLPDLAEAVSGQRLDADGVVEAVPVENLIRLRERLSVSTEDTPAARWARWYCADRGARTVSPTSDSTMQDYVRQCIEVNTVSSLGEAVRLAPTNGLAFARLAWAMASGSGEQNPRLVGEAAFYSRHALKLSPHDPEVRDLCDQVAQALPRKVEMGRPGPEGKDSSAGKAP